MLEIKNITKIYDNEKKAVDDLSLNINKGEIFGFVGPNGAGKTTTIRMITGILEPTAGNITIAGNNIEKEPIASKKCFTYVPDHPEIFDAINVLFGNSHYSFSILLF
jgi:ABC-2 type transport system ATP-binding protein